MELNDIVALVARLEGKMDQTLDQVTRINGRISQLEEWRIEKEKKDAYERGARQAREGVILTRGHIAILAGATGIVTAIVELSMWVIG